MSLLFQVFFCCLVCGGGVSTAERTPTSLRQPRPQLYARQPHPHPHPVLTAINTPGLPRSARARESSFKSSLAAPLSFFYIPQNNTKTTNTEVTPDVLLVVLDRFVSRHHSRIKNKHTPGKKNVPQAKTKNGDEMTLELVCRVDF